MTVPKTIFFFFVLVTTPLYLQAQPGLGGGGLSIKKLCEKKTKKAIALDDPNLIIHHFVLNDKSKRLWNIYFNKLTYEIKEYSFNIRVCTI